MPSDQYVIEVKLKRDLIEDFGAYPFCLNAVRNLSSLHLHPAVTFIIGENGSGKSTLVEAIAVASGFNAEGGSKNFRFGTHASHSDLYKFLRLSRGTKRPRDGYFLRAESFFNVATEIIRLDEEGMGPPVISSYGGKSLHAQSHGESFFALFNNRFGGDGFYILDEPEAALSPTRQMSMLARMHQLVRQRSQFVIATHSPIIMAYPNARIYEMGEEGAVEVSYEETEHFRVTRDFLKRSDYFLKKLLDETEEDFNDET